MKTVQSYALSLWLAGSAIAAPCWAQEALSAAGGRVETNVVLTPEVRVETRAEDPAGATIVQQRQTGTGSERLFLDTWDAQTLKNYTAAQVLQNLSSLYSPEMAKKTRDIALLRQILTLKLTARDIEQALPLLRELKSSDKVVPAKPEQAMDEEYQSLLRSKPGDPMPPSSADALRDAASGFRSRKQAIWEKMGQQLGREKAAGIRAMLRSESSTGWSGSKYQNFFISGPVLATPFVSPQLRTKPDAPARVKPAPAPEADPASPDGPVSVKPADGDESTAQSSTAAADPFQDTTAEADGAEHTARSRVARPAVAQANPAGNTTPDAVAAAHPRQERETRRAPARSQGTSTTSSQNGSVLSPLARTLTLDSALRKRIVYSYYGQVTVDELIDLFERKLAAMRR